MCSSELLRPYPNFFGSRLEEIGGFGRAWSSSEQVGAATGTVGGAWALEEVRASWSSLELPLEQAHRHCMEGINFRVPLSPNYLNVSEFLLKIITEHDMNYGSIQGTNYKLCFLICYKSD